MSRKHGRRVAQSAGHTQFCLASKMEKQQVDFLDQAGKRIVELCAALLGVFFAVMALGDTFPPPFLQGNDPARGLTVVTLAFYLAAMLTGVLAIQPREYRRYRHNLTEMRKVIDEIISRRLIRPSWRSVFSQ